MHICPAESAVRDVADMRRSTCCQQGQLCRWVEIPGEMLIGKDRQGNTSLLFLTTQRHDARQRTDSTKTAGHEA